MLHDPLRRQSTSVWVGVVVALLVCAGAAVMSLLRPAPDVDRAAIMVGQDSGAMYVRQGELVHPVLNLASARLIAGSAQAPVMVRDSDIAATRRGGTLGIVGAPSTLPTALDGYEALRMRWGVCDQQSPDGTTVTATVVIVDRADEKDAADHPGPVTSLPPAEAILASYDDQGWLLRGGTRAQIDLADTALLEALGLAGHPVRQVSAALLEALPDVGKVARVTIPGAGAELDYGLPGLRVGQVFTVDTSDGQRTYVALADGIQRVGRVAADLIRAGSTVGSVASVSPDALDVPRSTAVDTTALPDEIPGIPAPAAKPVVCVRTSNRGDASKRTSDIVVGTALPLEQSMVPTALADGPGPAVDAVVIPAGGVLVAAAARHEPAGSHRWPVTVVDGTGVRFDIPDAETATILGIAGTPVAVDSATVQRLPAGATLRRDSAMVMHSGVAGSAPSGDSK